VRRRRRARACACDASPAEAVQALASLAQRGLVRLVVRLDPAAR
jgi:hypothetical protein